MAGLKVPTSFTARDRFSGPIKRMQSASKKFASRTQASFARAERAARRFQSKVSSLNSKLFNLKNAAGVLAAGMITKKLKGLADQTATTADNVQKTARRVDMSTDALEGYRYAAEKAGVSSTMFDKSMESLGKRVSELQNDTGTLYTKLEKRGNTALIKQLKNVESNEEAMLLLSDAMKEQENQIQKQGLASAAFSKTNQKLMQALDGGREQLIRNKEEWKDYGVSLSDINVDAEEYKNMQLRMNTSLEGLRRVVGAKLMPIVQEYMQGLSDWIKNNKDLIATKAEEWVAKFKGWLDKAWTMLKSFGSSMRTVISVLWGMISALLWILWPLEWLVSLFSDSSDKGDEASSSMETLGTALAWATGAVIAMNIASKAMLFIQGIIKVATAVWTGVQWALNVALNANPIGLVVSALVALIAAVYGRVKLVQSAIANFKSWGSIILWLMGPIGWIIILIKTIYNHWQRIKNAFADKGIIGGLKAIGVAILDAILLPIQTILETVAMLPEWLGGGVAKSGAEGIKSMRKQIGALNSEVEETGKKAKEMDKAMGGQNKEDFMIPGGDPIQYEVTDKQTEQKGKEGMRNELDINMRGQTDQATVKKRREDMKMRIRNKRTQASFKQGCK